MIDGLKSGRIGSLALDVYEEEADRFFEDRSSEITGEALAAIAETTLANLSDLQAGRSCANEIRRS